MYKNKSASLEARLKNSKDLITFIKEYELYDPTPEDLKKENYETFVAEVDNAVTPLKNRSGALVNSAVTLKAVIKEVKQKSKYIRAEMHEIKGKDSEQYRLVNNIVKLITGENISEHSKRKQKIKKNLKEGEPEPEFNSVSELNRKSILGNFRSLLQLLKNFDFYNPSDSNITIAALEDLKSRVTSSLADFAEKQSEFVNESSRISHYFDDKNGLKDRARRAKIHVKRKYGKDSQEYAALSKKKY